MSYRDHFSKQSSTYAQSRPHYPPELFAYLASLAPGRELAWDCGTGNGQAALALAEHFDRVVATDASAEQIAHAFDHERVDYRVEQAEVTSFADHTVDLLTVAQAVHWFELDAFYAEVRRVLKPRGVIAVWTYHLPEFAPEIDRQLLHYYEDVLDGYWPELFRYVDDRYRSLPFPFEEIDPPSFNIPVKWTLGDALGFLGSWSATQKVREREGTDPIDQIREPLAAAWGSPDRERQAMWPLHMRVGRVGAQQPGG